MLTGPPLLFLVFFSIVLVVVLCARFRVNPFLALILAGLFVGIGAGMPLASVVDAIQSGFGDLMKYIGLIVVLGSVIGVFLEQSGAARRLAEYVISLAGKQRTIGAMSFIGAIISIPVFCDSGFILLSGLSEKLARLSVRNKASLSLALATGLYTTHTLVPPTPGPIAAAGNLGASDYLGTMILVGMAVSIPILILTQFLVHKLGASIGAGSSGKVVEEQEGTPSLFRSMLPLLVPIVLIGLGTLLPFIDLHFPWVRFMGNPMIALLIGALLAMFTLGPPTRKTWTKNFTKAITVAGPILIITGAGGAFGGVLKATPLSETVGFWLSEGTQSEILVLVLVFVIAAVLKTAQGSSTSAMVIASSVLAPLVPVLGWDSPMDFALAVLAIGGGAMTISHYNDSYFWVVSQFSGISHDDTYRSFSLLTGVMGLSVLVLTILCRILIR